MADLTLLAVGATQLVGAVVYSYVGFRIYQRRVAPPARLASAQFTIWWYGLAASGVITGLADWIAAAGALTYPLGITAYLLMILVDVGLLWGLVSYFAYVYSGRYYLLALGGFYAAFYIALLEYIFVQVPSGVTIRGGAPSVVYTVPANTGLEAFIVLALVVPEFIGVCLYLSLYRRATNVTRRYRILLVGTSLLMWLLVAFFTPSTSNADGLVKGGFEVLASVISLIAFLPPEWVRRRFGVTGIDTSALDAAAGRGFS
jgi:hypothetical protein